jgi:hypothetical protein
MPAATFGGEYLHTDIYQMASAYLFHIVKSHPFIDGNKRVGAVAALIFLALNGYDFTAPQEKFADFVYRVGELDKADVAVFIRKWARLRPAGGASARRAARRAARQTSLLAALRSGFGFLAWAPNRR